MLRASGVERIVSGDTGPHAGPTALMPVERD